MGSFVEILLLIIHLLLNCRTRIARRFNRQTPAKKQKKSNNNTPKPKKQKAELDTLDRVMFHGMRLKQEEDKCIQVGYHRPLQSQLEFISTIMYQNSSDFRSEMRRIQEILHNTEHYANRIRNRTACAQMQHLQMSEIPNINILEPRALRSARQGITYGKNLQYPYGGRKGFASDGTLGNCASCGMPLPVWRSCLWCVQAFFNYAGEDIFIKSIECPIPSHQYDLEGDYRCARCNLSGGIQIRVFKQGTYEGFLDYLSDENDQEYYEC